MARISNFDYFKGRDRESLENMHVEVVFDGGVFKAKLYDGEFYYTGKCVSQVGAIREALNDYYGDNDNFI